MILLQLLGLIVMDNSIPTPEYRITRINGKITRTRAANSSLFLLLNDVTSVWQLTFILPWGITQSSQVVFFRKQRNKKFSILPSLGKSTFQHFLLFLKRFLKFHLRSRETACQQWRAQRTMSFFCHPSDTQRNEPSGLAASLLGSSKKIII